MPAVVLAPHISSVLGLAYSVPMGSRSKVGIGSSLKSTAPPSKAETTAAAAAAASDDRRRDRSPILGDSRCPAK